MIVAITQRIDDVEGRNERRDSLDQRLTRWVTEAGYTSIPVPNIYFNKKFDDYTKRNKSLDAWLTAVRPGALLLSGGNDIGEYGERDNTENYLLSWAKSLQRPVLGICRGMQMMAVSSGVSLVRVDEHVRVHHKLKSVTGFGIFPETVNSFHEWALESCPENFDVIARTEDGNIEAIRHSSLPWEGWMWHPERAESFSEIDSNRLKQLFINKDSNK